MAFSEREETGREKNFFGCFGKSEKNFHFLNINRIEHIWPKGLQVECKRQNSCFLKKEESASSKKLWTDSLKRN